MRSYPLSVLPSPQSKPPGPITRAIQRVLGKQIITTPVMIGSFAESRAQAPGNVYGAMSSWAFQQMKIESGRLAAYRDYEQMDAEVPEVNTALRLASEFATQSDDEKPESFTIVCEDNKTKKYLDAKCAQLKLHQLVTPAAREVMKYGCAYWELVAPDNAKTIVGCNPLPPPSMVRHEDEYGQLKSPAFVQRDITNTKDTAKFEPWQIVHVRYRQDMSFLYGNSMLAAGRRVFKQLQLMEDGVVVGRLYRSHVRFVFFVPVEGTTQDAAESHLDRIRAKFKKKARYNMSTGKIESFDAPMTSEEDFWIGLRKDGPQADVKVLQGSGNLGQLADVEFFHDKLLCALGIPKRFLQFSRDAAAKANTGHELTVWSKSLRRLQQVMNEGVSEVLRRCMIVDGIDPEAKEWSVAFPPISSGNEQKSASVLALRIDCAVGLLNSGLADREYIYKNVLQLGADESERLLALRLGSAPGGAGDNSAGAASAKGIPRPRALLTPEED